MSQVEINSKELGITEDINIDNGCLLLFSIDRYFD
jgi:hypothetical protein